MGALHIVAKLGPTSPDQFEFLHDHELKAKQTVTLSHIESVLNMVTHDALSHSHKKAEETFIELKSVIQHLNRARCYEIAEPWLGVKGCLEYLLLLGFSFADMDDEQIKPKCVQRPSQKLLKGVLQLIEWHLDNHKEAQKPQRPDVGDEKEDGRLHVFGSRKLEEEYVQYDQEAKTHQRAIDRIRRHIQDIETRMRESHQRTALRRIQYCVENVESVASLERQRNEQRARLRIRVIAQNRAYRHMNWLRENEAGADVESETTWHNNHQFAQTFRKRKKAMSIDDYEAAE